MSSNPRWEECRKGNQDLPFHSLPEAIWTTLCRVSSWGVPCWDCTHKTLLSVCVPWRLTLHLHQRVWLGIKWVNRNIMFLHSKKRNHHPPSAWRFYHFGSTLMLYLSGIWLGFRHCDTFCIKRFASFHTLKNWKIILGHMSFFSFTYSLFLEFIWYDVI